MYKADYSSILDYIIKGSKTWENKEAFVIRRQIKKETVLYKDIPPLLEKLVNWFLINNIQVDDKVLFWGTNCPEYSLSLLACMSFGRVAIPIDWRNSKETINRIIDKTKPKYALISKYFKHDFLTERSMKVFYIEDIFNELPSIATKQKLQKILKHKTYKDPNKTVEIVFTSGTTGKPKGVVMKQRNVLANLKAVESFLPDLEGSRTISLLPLSHMFEQVVGLLLPIGHGTTIYYLPRINSFRILQSFSEYKPTHLVFVPQMLKMFWERIEDKAKQSGKYDVLQKTLELSPLLPKSLRKILFYQIHKIFGGKLNYVACGGAPLDKKTGEYWHKVGLPIIEGYGATEVTAIATVNNFNSPKLGTVGKPVMGVDITIDEDGEIYIKSDSVSGGYYYDKAKTSAAFTNRGYKTGDIGKFDSEGNLQILGRDVFKIVLPSGEKVFVEDLETKILQDSRIKETCVVAVRTSGGDKIRGYFITKKGVDDPLKKIVTEINKNLESKQQISSYKAWPNEDFPRTPTLKIDRKSVFEVANKHKNIDSVTATDTNNAFGIQNILDVLSKVSGIQKDRILDSDTLSGDLSIDSLTRVEVVALTEEHLGIILDEGKITAKTTVKDLKLMVKNSEIIEEVNIPDWQFSKFGRFLNKISLNYFLLPLHSSIIKIKYSQKIIPTIEPGSIILFNHPGILDGVCVVRTLKKQGLTSLVTNAGAYFWTDKTILAKPLELFIGGIPLYESGHKLVTVLRKDSDLLDSGYNLLFAPQGELQKTKDEAPFKLGIGYIVQQLNVPVYIIKIKGYRDLWPVPEKGLAKSNTIDLLPRKGGEVKVVVSKKILPNWDNFTPIQITNLLEERFREL